MIVHNQKHQTHIKLNDFTSTALERREQNLQQFRQIAGNKLLERNFPLAFHFVEKSVQKTFLKHKEKLFHYFLCVLLYYFASQTMLDTIYDDLQ